jgi:hypothetical protein
MTKCFFCERNDADDPDYYVKETLYLVVSRGTNISFSYRTRDVKIERCKECYEEDTKFSWVIHLITFLGILIMIILTLREIKLNEWYLLLMAGFIGYIAGRFVSIPVLLIIAFFRDKTSKNSETKIKLSKDYPLITEMLKIGWLLDKPDPSGSSADESYKKYKKYLSEGGKDYLY